MKVRELQKLALGRAENLPLFDQPKEGGCAEANGSTSAEGSASSSAADCVTLSDESWRSVPLADVLPANLAAKLADHNPSLTTVGELSDWQNASEHNQLTTIKGVGAAKVEKIEDALAEFWGRWNAEAGARKAAAIPDADIPVPSDFVLTDDEKAAFRAGWRAFVAGEKKKACPHPKSSSDAVQWRDGWDRAKAAEAAENGIAVAPETWEATETSEATRAATTDADADAMTDATAQAEADGIDADEGF